MFKRFIAPIVATAAGFGFALNVAAGVAHADFSNQHLGNEAGLWMSADGAVGDLVYGKDYANNDNQELFSQTSDPVCTDANGNHVSTVIYDPTHSIFCPFNVHLFDEDLQGNPIVTYTTHINGLCLGSNSGTIAQKGGTDCTSGNGILVVLGNPDSNGYKTNVWVKASDDNSCHDDTTSHGVNIALQINCANGHNSQYWRSA